MNKIIKLLKIVLKMLSLHVDEKNTIRENKSIIAGSVTCNNKLVLLDYDPTRTITNNYILLKINSNVTSCTYRLLDKYIDITLSSKINILFSKIIKFIHNPELHNNVKSERLIRVQHEMYVKDEFGIDDIMNETISSKLLQLNKAIKKNSVKDALIKFNFKCGLVKIEDKDTLKSLGVSKIIDDRNYICSENYIGVSFPMYELLKEIKNNKLLGVEFTTKELSLVKYMYKYIFENIDDKNSYSFIDNPLLTKDISSPDKKDYRIKSKSMQDTFMLIKAFVSIAKNINTIFDEIAFIDNCNDEKFDLNNIDEIISTLERKLPFVPYLDFENNKDGVLENKRYNYKDIKSLNKSLNNKIVKADSKVYQTKDKSFSKKTINKNSNNLARRNGFGSSFITPFSNNIFKADAVVLDPTDDSFDKIFTKKDMFSNRYLVAGTGFGKSETTKIVALKDIQDLENNFILIDGGQKLALEFAKLVNPDRLVYIDQSLNDNYSFTINPIDQEDKSERNLSIMSKHLAKSFELLMAGSWSDNMEAVLIPILYIAMSAGGYDIFSLKKLLDDKNYEELKELALKCPNKHHRDFIINDLQRIKTIKQTKDAIYMKLQSLSTDDLLVNCISGKNSFDIEKLINTPGKIIIVKPESNAFGIFLMATIQGIIEKRDVHNYIHTNMYVDEFQLYASTSVTTMLRELRKKGLHLTMINQDLEDIKEIQSSIFTNTNIKIVGKNSYKNLVTMSKELQVDIKELENLDIGEFYIKVGIKKAIKIKVADKFIDQKGAMGDEEWQECVEKQLKLYYNTIDSNDIECNSAKCSTVESDKYKLKKQLAIDFNVVASSTTNIISDDF